ncbi:hypothetical protein [Rubritalea tangerina]
MSLVRIRDRPPSNPALRRVFCFLAIASRSRFNRALPEPAHYAQWL